MTQFDYKKAPCMTPDWPRNPQKLSSLVFFPPLSPSFVGAGHHIISGFYSCTYYQKKKPQ
jgi:hypothetical protein